MPGVILTKYGLLGYVGFPLLWLYYLPSSLSYQEVNANPALLLEMSSKAAEQETAVQKKRKGGGASGGGKKGGKGRRRESEEMEKGRGVSWELVFMPPKDVSSFYGRNFSMCVVGALRCEIL